MAEVVTSGKTVEAAKPPKAKRSGILVTLDTEAQDVLKLDAEGYQLTFAVELDKFLQLNDEQVRTLSYENRVAYGIAQGLWKKAVKDKDQPVSSGIAVLPPAAASAGRRLEVFGAPPGWHYVWKRTDELQSSAGEGYTMAGSEVKTMYWDGSTHKIAAFGQTELVLMRIPQEKYEAIEKAAGARSRALIDASTSGAEEAIRRAGGVPFEPDDKPDGRKWKESEEGR